MISENAQRFIRACLTTSCNFLQLVPYTWDADKKRLAPASRNRLVIYNIQVCIHTICLVFTIVRFRYLFSAENVPVRTYMLHIIWSVAHLLSTIVYYQQKMKREEIMWFVIALLDYIEKDPGQHFRIFL